jgi:glucose/arabinose dehydrogenase
MRVPSLGQSTTSAFLAAASALWFGAATQTALAGPEERPGDRFEITVDDLPKPFATSSALRFPTIVKRNSRMPLAPAGFKVSIFADKLDHPRWMTVAPNGDVFLAESNEGKITLLRDTDGDGRAEERFSYATGFRRPHGLAIRQGEIFVSDVRAIWRMPYAPAETASKARRPLTQAGAFGNPGSHWTRNFVFAPNGEAIFVAIGSRSNASEDPLPLASVQRFDANGRNRTTFASGLRNPIGIAFYPNTQDLYVVVNERDGLGDGLVPDYLTRIREGEFFGWPYAYLGGIPDPDQGAKKPNKVASTVGPDILFEAHSAPVGLAFNKGDNFPEDMRGDGFVALRGSWNAGAPTGYKVVRVKFEKNRPSGGYENFLTGFWISGLEKAEVIGRPAGLVFANDGALLIADDSGGVIWRVAYTAADQPAQFD